MAAVVKIALNDFNPDRLGEELVAAGLMPLITSLGWAGFERVTPRRYTPAAARRVVGMSSVNGVRTEDLADPGELRFGLTRDVTPTEAATLDGVLSAHDAALLSAEQVRQDKDEADLDTLLATERQAYLTALQDWDGMTSAQKLAATRAMFLTIGKLFRVILRRERGAAI